MREELVRLNREIYNATAPLYEDRHHEIFNPTEQERIHDQVRWGLGEIQTDSTLKHVLDFGAGTGNLTRHILDLGAAVVAADVSSGCLRELRASLTGRERLETSLLNGHTLHQFDSGTFDMVATYSVLHHVPDYLTIIDEFIRVLKPGGIVYIDHEVCPTYWDDNPAYLQYWEELNQVQAERKGIMRCLFDILSRKDRLRYLLASLWLRMHRIADEGDIHVHKDDHIEWQSIRSRLELCCEILKEEDYLVCREPTSPPAIWERWCDRCVDMRLLVARKR